MKLTFFMKHLLQSSLPKWYFDSKKKALEKKFITHQDYIQDRVNYYCPLKPFTLKNGTQIQNYKKNGGSSYFFDLKEYLYFFPKHYEIAYHFGDETHRCDEATLFKARPIGRENETSVLLKLNKHRHFRFVDDEILFENKHNKAIFRGAVHAHQPHRVDFINSMFDKPMIDAGETNKSKYESLDAKLKKPFMSKAEQLENKFIFCLEGNDVASNLKWVMNSNSIAITPKMKYETWFMEGRLKGDHHYIEVDSDYSNCIEKLEYYANNSEESQKIIKNAHDFIEPFKNEELELLICLSVLERYFYLSGQLN